MKHLTALLLAVIWLVLATTGIALGQSRPQGIVVSPAKPSLSIELRLSKECLSPRERLTLKFTLDRAAYVYIYNIDSKGKVWLLFPNGFSRNPWVSKGEHTLPDSNEYSIVIEGPPGVEYIQAIASLRPIPLFQHDSTRNKAFLFLSADPKAFAAKLDTWLKKNLPQGSWATDWAEYGVSLGRLIITSWPPDAKIYVDDKYRGTTQPEEEAKVAKMELWLPTGYHRISVTKEGFRSRSQTIHLKPCKTKSLVFWLEEPGRVSISSFPRGATIYIDGRSLGATPKEFDVGSGKHTIELYKPGYKLWTRDLYLSPGERKDLYAKLQVNLSPEGRFKFTPLKPLVGEEVTFDASASYDVDGSIASYKWDFDGDGKADAEGARVSHAFKAFGRHKVTLTVTDDDGASDSASLVLRVRARPTAGFSFSPKSPFVGDQVRFDASSSYDPDGAIVAYKWDFGDGTTAEGRSTAHVYDTPGTYSVTLLVRDDDDYEARATRSVEVVRGGKLSISCTPEGASAYLNGEYRGTTPLTTTKLAEGSYTIALKLKGYKDWSSVVSIPEQNQITAKLIAWGRLTVRSDPAGAKVQLDGRAAGETTEQGVTLYLEGEHRLELTRCGYTVWSKDVAFANGESQQIQAKLERITAVSIVSDPSGAEIMLDGRSVGKTPATVAIDPSIGKLTLIKEGYKPWSTACITTERIHVDLRNNEPPVAQISGPTNGMVDEDLAFSGGGSYDPDGKIVAYKWEFGDGTMVTGRFVRHRYEGPGTYQVKLTVTDNDGSKGEATKDITIESHPIASRPQDLIESVPFSLGLDVGRGKRGWSLGFLIGGDVRIGGSITFTGDEVPDYYEVPHQPWEGEVYNLGPELELCGLAATPFIAGVSLECGVGISFQQRVHIATMPAAQRETRLLPQRAVILPNGYTDRETNFSAFGGISIRLEEGMLSLRYHTRRGWIVGIGLEF